MSGASGSPLARFLSGFWANVPDPVDSDEQLLARFVAGSEPAFGALVRRHGPMVFGVCRRLLGHVQDAEDAFQAAFMVLANQAGSIRKSASVASWLYGVAYRVACKAQRAKRRRLAGESGTRYAPALSAGPDSAWRELCAILDEELNRLPEKYRAVLVLCYLEGKSNEAAARQLGCTKGTVSSRIWRGRELLRERLTRRRLTLSAGVAVGLFGVGTASGAVPGKLIYATVQAAIHFTVGGAAGGHVATPAVLLAQEVLRTMFLTNYKFIVTMTLALALSVFGGGMILQKVQTAPPETPKAAPRRVTETAPVAVQASPAVAQRDLQADKRKSMDNLKHIGLAMHSYCGDFGHFPPAAIMARDNKALLSWRVAILPYLDQGALFKEFKLDEAWDSPHNQKLLARMPDVYAPPGIKTVQPHATFYRVFVGPGTIFESTQGCRPGEIADGTSNTLMVVEAGEPVPWTKPQELPYQKDKALPALGGILDGDFCALVADGSVHVMDRNPNARLMHLFIQRSDGITFYPSDLQKKQP
jgi:RNA polymerase sigma factor (sigma-70 family)